VKRKWEIDVASVRQVEDIKTTVGREAAMSTAWFPEPEAIYDSRFPIYGS
jgi:hypothetical protein